MKTKLLDSKRRCRKEVMTSGNYNEETTCSEDAGPNDSTESEISDAESEKFIEKSSQEKNPKRCSGVSMILSKRGRKIVKPNYNYDSSSEQTSDAEVSRTASPLICKFSMRNKLTELENLGQKFILLYFYCLRFYDNFMNLFLRF